MSLQKYKLSAEKIEELELELEGLRTKGRKDIADNLVWLRSLPNDLEDVTFSEILEDKSYLEKRIAELKELLSNSEEIHKDATHDYVEIGSIVKVGFEGYEEDYTIVSAVEANPLEKKISDESPVGKALMDGRVGDVVRVETGSVIKKFRILKIG